MSNIHMIYPTGSSLYGKATNVSGGGVGLTEVTDTLYVGDSSLPYIFDASDDTLVGRLDEQHYGTVTGGDKYHLTRMHSYDWNNGTTVDKVQALYTATYLMDKFNFIGSKTDADQGLEFPRTRTTTDGTVNLIGGTADVPANITKAAYLIADVLLSGRDPQADFEAQNVKVETFGPVRTEYATDKGPMQHTSNMIPSPSAWALILPFLGISTGFSVNKS